MAENEERRQSDVRLARIETQLNVGMKVGSGLSLIMMAVVGIGGLFVYDKVDQVQENQLHATQMEGRLNLLEYQQLQQQNFNSMLVDDTNIERRRIDEEYQELVRDLKHHDHD